MANIGTFTAQKDGLVGTIRTLTLNVKARFVLNDDKARENSPDYYVEATGGYNVGAAWNKTSEAGREYRLVALDDPWFPKKIYAHLYEREDGTHDLVWSRSKPQQPTA